MDAREVFRAALAVDDATWLRSRGWALSQALLILSYYTMDTNPTLVREARRRLAHVLADQGATVQRARRPDRRRRSPLASGAISSSSSHATRRGWLQH